jgi:hypothetical protein
MTEDHFLIRYESPLIQGNLIKQVAKIEYFNGVDIFGGHLPRRNLIAKFDVNGEKSKPNECIRKIKTIEEGIRSIEGVSDIEYLGSVVTNYDEKLKVR